MALAKYVVNKLRIITRPLRLYYPMMMRFYFIRFVFFTAGLLGVKSKNLENLHRSVLDEDIRKLLFTWPFKMRMATAETFRQIRLWKWGKARVSEKYQARAARLTEKGYTGQLDLVVPQKDCMEVVEYFRTQPTVFTHSYSGAEESDLLPCLDVLEKNRMELPKYLSFPMETQLNCQKLLELSIHPEIVETAAGYLGCFPKLQFINTFWTLPSDEEAWLATYHRDLDDYKCATFMFNWTDTIENNSGTEYIAKSQRPSRELSKLLVDADDQKFLNKCADNMLEPGKMSDVQIFDAFRLSSDPGYRQNDRYEKIFGPASVISTSGTQGSVFCLENYGLHRGPVFKGKRLISWLRYGVSDGYPGRTVKTQSRERISGAGRIIADSPYGFVLGELFESHD